MEVINNFIATVYRRVNIDDNGNPITESDFQAEIEEKINEIQENPHIKESKKQ